MTPAQALRKLERGFDLIFSVARWQCERVLIEHGASPEEIAAALAQQDADLAKWRREARQRISVWFEHGVDLH
jgi:hypothetical protein